MASGSERRRKGRLPSVGDVRIALVRSNGEIETIRGKLVDSSDWGIGVDTTVPLEVGTEITLWCSFFAARSGGADRRRARVLHSRVGENGTYRAGCRLEEPLDPAASSQEGAPSIDTSSADYYEILQISPHAEPETIHRVYRMMAQRYHPDNAETGDEKIFQVILEAYQVLIDPEKRAAYDVRHSATHSLRWKIFEEPKSAQGIDAEQKKRDGILSLLYAKMAEDPSQPGIMVRDLEDLLGCPREHLQFTLWYLKQKSLIAGPDNGRYSITADGVDVVEEKGEQRPIRPLLEGSGRPMPETAPATA